MQKWTKEDKKGAHHGDIAKSHGVGPSDATRKVVVTLMIETIGGGELVIETVGEADLQEETSMTAVLPGDIGEEMMIAIEIVTVDDASREILVSPSQIMKTAIEDVSAQKASQKTKIAERVDQDQLSIARRKKAPKVKKSQSLKRNRASPLLVFLQSTLTKSMESC